MARRRHNAAERREWAAKYRASGLSGAAFAREHGLEVESVYRWGREFAEAQATSANRAGFEEVRVRAEVGTPTGGEVELCLGNGRSLRVGPASDLELVASLVRMLESC